LRLVPALSDARGAVDTRGRRGRGGELWVFGPPSDGVDVEVAWAEAEGVPVRALRIACVTVGSMLAGLGGAHITLGFSHTWLEGVTAGRGWVAIGLVVLARWNPLYVFPVAYVFGGVVALQLNAQAAGFGVSPYLLSMLPYVLTVAALAFTHYWARGSGMPEELKRTETGV
jgi:simple sugar transport system permease protein